MEYAPPSPAELAVKRTRTNSVDMGLKATVCVPPVPVTMPAEVVTQVPPDAW